VLFISIQGTVEATLDEEVAAEKWSSRKEEPEYVI
jgi:general stress protein 26